MNVPALMATYQLRQREYLLRITRAMTSRLDLPSALRLILNSAAELVGCRAGLIVLEEEMGFGQARTVTKYQIRAYYGIAAHYLPAFEPLLDVAPLVQSNYDETMAQLDDHMVDLQARVRQVESKLGLTLGQVVGLPLLFEDELLGMIYLFRTEYAFTQLDWQFLQGFADQAAVAVRNARLYHQLETERSRLATIVENSAHGILILNAERRVLVINQALAAMLDIQPESAMGKICSEVLMLQNVKGDDVCQNETFTNFPTKESLHSEGDLQRPGGSRLTVSVTYTPLYDEQEQLVNIVVNVHDITRFREEEEIKSTFTSIISHELKTPVALIKGYAQTLARPDATWDAETARQSLQVIEEEADRLEALINNLLDASRIQASGLRLDYGDVNLVRLAQRVADGYQLQTANHHLELDFPTDLPLVWGDEERLRQVMTNLVSNAIKYSPKGGIVRIGGWVEDDESARPSVKRRVVIYVADQGIGIPVQELPLVFDRFYRVDSTLRRGTAGSGLGLYLTKTIVEAHGGQIWARSEPNKGTTFFFALPFDAMDEIPPDEQAERPHTATPTRSSPPLDTPATKA